MILARNFFVYFIIFEVFYVHQKTWRAPKMRADFQPTHFFGGSDAYAAVWQMLPLQIMISTKSGTDPEIGHGEGADLWSIFLLKYHNIVHRESTKKTEQLFTQLAQNSRIL